MADKKPFDFGAYATHRANNDTALAQIREIRATQKSSKEWLKKNEGEARKALAAAGDRLVAGNYLFEFTKGGQIRITTVAVAG